ncbi:LanC-like protein [Terasakiella sp. A23]|uniref:lanthionine synthetase C family protein n=1 Tax=Terasakiella sp. FCG-A23 TaxID=3080561 RepID=UPI0029532F99|nr:LanC-like protein [Terasakiella sp. A23]MDV7340363.1 LanC-like protein [Terasakiella sp. A23]
MTSLYDFERHTDLTDRPWSAQDAYVEIARILDEIRIAKQWDGGWPLHPLDAESYLQQDTKWALYAGAAGVVVATEILRRSGYSTLDLRDQLPQIYRNFLKNPDLGAVEMGLQVGELGILVPAILSDPTDKLIQTRARQCMSRLLDHPAHEITSGQTGMMYAALALYRATNEDCWKSAFKHGAEALWLNWYQVADGSGWLWDNDIFGQKRSYFGACHGIAGNLNVVLQGADLLSDNHITNAIDRTIETLKSYALHENGMVNWFASAPPIKGRLFVQWCHGAAGIVTALSAVPKTKRPALDTLLAEASALVWHAGPLTKGPGICHGTAGNGYAFLAMYHRDGKSHWLDKARAFASHAIQQSQEHRAQYGQRRFSLMTGDAGLAVYLHHCLNPDEWCLPGLDLFS